MHDAETRALRRAASVLLVLSAVRLGWSRTRPAVRSDGTGGDVLAGLQREAHEHMAEATRRDRPLAGGERVDPNRATAADLDRLPGVGAKVASAIVQERERSGPFQRPEDLLRVRGIGPGMLRRIRSHLDLSDPPRPAPRSVLDDAPPPGRNASSAPQSSPPAPPIDVNQADATALQSLPGVGPALARRIVESRRQGPFRSLQDLARVKGIGPATLARLRDRVRFVPGP